MHKAGHHRQTQFQFQQLRVQYFEPARNLAVSVTSCRQLQSIESSNTNIKTLHPYTTSFIYTNDEKVNQYYLYSMQAKSQ